MTSDHQPRPGDASPRAIDLLWLEPTPVGSAARAHLDGTLARLRALRRPVRTVLAFQQQSHGGYVSKFRRLLTLIRAARALDRGGVLVARWHPFLGFVSKRWRRRGGKVVLLVQGNEDTFLEIYPWLKRVPGARSMITASLREADSVLVLNQGLADWVVVRCPPAERGWTPVVLPTGVDDRFAHAHVEGAPPGDYALFFGNFAKWQGIKTILDAVIDPAWPSDLKVVFAGSGAMAAAVVGAAGPLITYAGALSVDDLAPLVAGALFTLCPKDDTGSMAKTTTPFKILESVAAGVPVIATDIPGQRALLEPGGYGLLVKAGDAHALAAAASRLATSPDLRRQLTAAAVRAVPTLTWEYGAPILGEEIERVEDSEA